MAQLKQQRNDEAAQNDVQTALHWYDFLCPFCYVGQQRNAILARRGLHVVELPFQAHPDIPVGGIAAGPRSGPMYTTLEREAKETGLPLHWPPHLPNTLLALAAAEWIRQHEPRASPQMRKALFEAHFVLNEDLEDPAVIDRHARQIDVDLTALHAAIADKSAIAAVKVAETVGRSYGIKGTPAWLINRQLILGLRPAEEFERLAANIVQSSG